MGRSRDPPRRNSSRFVEHVMGNYWVGDNRGRVLGPVTLDALAQLLKAGRLAGLDRASRDGKEFKPIDQVPELHQLIDSARTHRKTETDREQARALVAQI